MNVNPDDTRFCSVKPINFDMDCFSFCQGLNSVGWSLPGQNPVLTHCFTVSSQNKYRNTFNFKPQQQILFEKQTDADPCELLQQSLESLMKRDFAVTHTFRTAHQFQRLMRYLQSLGSEAENNPTYADPHGCETPVFSGVLFKSL